MDDSATMKRTWILLAIGVMVLLAGLGFVLAMSGGRLHAKARKDWKNSAIEEIAEKARDVERIKAEILGIREKMAQGDSHFDEWFSDHLIVAANGDWIVFASKCSKEGRHIHDIFIGLGSDGKWYYSTFHFCIGMITLRMEEQPADLTAFVNTYFLREFDGHSDECLNQTWPPDRR